WARRLGVKTAAVGHERVIETLAALRKQTRQQADDLVALADTAQVGAADRYEIAVDGTSVPVRLVPGEDGSWQVETVDRAPAPVPEPTSPTRSPEQPGSAMKRAWDRLKDS